MKGYKYYSIITGAFTACLIISNILDTKIFTILNLALPAGIILFPITYLFGDILTEVYGYVNSRKVIWIGFFSLILLTFTIKIAQLLPSATFWANQQSFELILGQVPRIVLASILAYFIGEFSNSYTLAKLKIRFKGKAMPFRFVVSTIVGEGVDTIVFVSIAFIGIIEAKELIFITLSAWAFKVIWEVVTLPITIPIVNWLKKNENEDYFDVATKFSPFKINS